jgi:hypothetical protein
MSEKSLFLEGDPFDDPAWKATEKAAKRAKWQTSDLLVGCPIPWLERAFPHLRGGHQVVVAMLLYRRWVVLGRHRTFSFSNVDLERFGIGPHAKRKALEGLKRAGLITFKYLPGHAVQVTRRWK